MRTATSTQAERPHTWRSRALMVTLRWSAALAAVASVTTAGLVAGPVSAAAAAETAGANLVVNGGFEQTPIMPGSWFHTWLPYGWQPLRAPAEVLNMNLGPAAEGKQYAEIDSSASMSLYQAVPTTAGASYILSLSYATRPGTGAEDNKLDVRWNGSPLEVLHVYGTNVSSPDWKTYTVLVHGAAKSAYSGLLLEDLGVSNGNGMLVDNVQVRPNQLSTSATATTPIGPGVPTANLQDLIKAGNLESRMVDLGGVSPEYIAPSIKAAFAAAKERNAQLLLLHTELSQLKSQRKPGVTDPALEKKIADKQAEIANLIAKDKLAMSDLDSLLATQSANAETLRGISKKHSELTSKITVNMS